MKSTNNTTVRQLEPGPYRLTSRTKPNGTNRFIREESKLTELPNNYRKVLDKGYVGLLGVHGSDRGVVSPPSAARTSFKKQASEFTDEQNDRLTHYLMRKKEFACFRHNVMTFELRMPLMVARQWWKYVVGSNFTEDQLGWNENSKRYITMENEFYIPSPTEWRSAPENKKQGSGEPLPGHVGSSMTKDLHNWNKMGEELYQRYLRAGAAPEQLRLFTANGNYVTVQWSTSLNALLHFLDERLGHGAQYEIVKYAEVVRDFFAEAFPVVHEAWESEREKAVQNEAKLNDYGRLIVELSELEAKVAALEEENKTLKKKWYHRLVGK